MSSSSWLPSFSLPAWSRSGQRSDPIIVADDNNQVNHGDDTPPPFPLPDSAQRSQLASSSIPSFSLAPPSPPRNLDSSSPSNQSSTIPSINAPFASMAPPPSTVSRPNFGINPGGDYSDSKPSNLHRNRKVALEPGFSALDWARLTKSGTNLRGNSTHFPLRVTLDELKRHNKPEDAWSAFNGRVYNLTPYLRFHPGGVDQLMRVAGRDGTKLFMLTHSWVNLEHLMQECMVGVLVRG